LFQTVLVPVTQYTRSGPRRTAAFFEGQLE
jgi:hypothetical protein